MEGHIWRGGEGGRRLRDGAVVPDVFPLLFHQQKPVGGEKTIIRRAAADAQPPTHSSNNPLMHMHTLTLALEGLQHGGVCGAQPGGVATQNPLQVVGGVAEEHVSSAVAR